MLQEISCVDSRDDDLSSSVLVSELTLEHVGASLGRLEYFEFKRSVEWNTLRRKNCEDEWLVYHVSRVSFKSRSLVLLAVNFEFSSAIKQVNFLRSEVAARHFHRILVFIQGSSLRVNSGLCFSHLDVVVDLSFKDILDVLVLCLVLDVTRERVVINIID